MENIKLNFDGLTNEEVYIASEMLSVILEENYNPNYGEIFEKNFGTYYDFYLKQHPEEDKYELSKMGYDNPAHIYATKRLIAKMEPCLYDEWIEDFEYEAMEHPDWAPLYKKIFVKGLKEQHSYTHGSVGNDGNGRVGGNWFNDSYSGTLENVEQDVDTENDTCTVYFDVDYEAEYGEDESVGYAHNDSSILPETLKVNKIVDSMGDEVTDDNEFELVTELLRNRLESDPHCCDDDIQNAIDAENGGL